MPGILGVIDPSGKIGPEGIRSSIKTMCSVLIHEPSYCVDSHIDEKWGVARISLKSEADVPFPFEQGQNRLFMTGELYRIEEDDVLGDNYYSRLTSALAKNVPQALNSIDGNFSLLFHHAESKELHIATDIVGARPIYYMWEDGVLYFAPEVKALLAARPDLKEIDEQGIADFLSSGTVYGDETYFKHIKCLRPSTLMSLSFRTAQMSLKKYWEFRYDESAPDRGEAAYKAELIGLIERAVARRVRDYSKKRVAISLSAGYDSRVILGVCIKNKIPIATISHGDDRNKPNSDAFLAKKIAEKLNVPNTFYPLDLNTLSDGAEKAVHLSDGLIFAIANYTGNEYAEIAQDCDVLLRGDELFGYRYAPFNDEEALAWAGYTPFSPIYKRVLAPDQYERYAQLSAKGLRQIKEKCPQKNLVCRKDFFFYDERIANVIGRINYLKHMHVAIRNPFHDRKILEFLQKLPPKYRLDKIMYIKAVREGYPNMFEIELAKATNLPSWKKTYRQSAKMREFIRKSLFRTDNEYFSGLVDFQKMEQFVADFSKEASITAPPGFLTRFKNRVIGKINYELSRRYRLNRLLQPIFKYKSADTSWVDSDYILIRLLVIRLWSDIFLTGSRTPS